MKKEIVTDIEMLLAYIQQHDDYQDGFFVPKSKIVEAAAKRVSDYLAAYKLDEEE